MIVISNMSKKYNNTNWRNEKIVSLSKAAKIAKILKQKGKKLVTVNGSFDLLHIGHLDQLEEANKQGDVLFVGINSDESIRGYKGDERPLIPEEVRCAMLAALACVNYVIVIDEKAEEVQNFLLRAVKPHVHVNGPDYGKPEKWIEYPVMQEVGAKGHVAQKLNDFSTTDLIKKIRE